MQLVFSLQDCEYMMQCECGCKVNMGDSLDKPYSQGLFPELFGMTIDNGHVGMTMVFNK